MSFNLIPSLLQAPQTPSGDDDFNVAGGEIFATFSPWASWLSDGSPFAPTPTTLLPAVGDGSAGTQGNPDSTVAVTSGGITINLIFDTAAMAAPASFRAGIQQAVAIMTAAISDKITVNIKIDYSGTGGGAAAGPDHGVFQSYSSIRADLINHATPGDTTFNALAAGSSIQGQSSVVVWNAQSKLWGLMAANDATTDDGSATFATDIDPSLLVGVALHELTHAMGRVPYGPQPDIFDLFRFSSAGTRLFQGGATAPAAYFSLDGGNTKLADYGRTSDPSDFLNSGVQGPNDPFNEFYNGKTAQQLTAADLKQLDALGFHLTVPDTISPSLVHDDSMSLAVGATAIISSNQLQFDDNVSSHAQETYTVVTGPTHGTLLKSGSAATSFTQADIDNGLIAYHETANAASPDSFTFKVADAAGNATGTAQFHFNVDSYSFAAMSDFNGDGNDDVLWRDDNGSIATWDMHDRSYSAAVVTTVPNDWHIAGAGDFNGDGKTDVLWRDDNGSIATWDMNDHSYSAAVVTTVSNDWHIAGTGDFNGDGKADVLWRNDSGSIATWDMNDHSYSAAVVGTASNDWHIAGTGDFNGDGKTDVLWRNDNGSIATWNMNDHSYSAAVVGTVSNDWHIAGTGDFNGDGKTDILWRNDNGSIATWDMNDHAYSAAVLTAASTDWHIA